MTTSDLTLRFCELLLEKYIREKAIEGLKGDALEKENVALADLDNQLKDLAKKIQTVL